MHKITLASLLALAACGGVNGNQAPLYGVYEVRTAMMGDETDVPNTADPTAPPYIAIEEILFEEGMNDLGMNELEIFLCRSVDDCDNNTPDGSFANEPWSFYDFGSSDGEVVWEHNEDRTEWTLNHKYFDQPTDEGTGNKSCNLNWNIRRFTLSEDGEFALSIQRYWGGFAYDGASVPETDCAQALSELALPSALGPRSSFSMAGNLYVEE